MSDPAPPLDPFAEIAASLPSFEDDADATLSLRQQAMRDPVRGAPMDLGHEGEEEMIEPGAWSINGHVNRRTGLPTNCPVTPLGKGVETFFFLNTLGQVTSCRRIPARATSTRCSPGGRSISTGPGRAGPCRSPNPKCRG